MEDTLQAKTSGKSETETPTLQVQEFLRTWGIGELKDRFNLSTRWHSKHKNLLLVRLKCIFCIQVLHICSSMHLRTRLQIHYDQLRSPLQNAIVQECRGIILDTEDGAELSVCELLCVFLVASFLSSRLSLSSFSSLLKRAYPSFLDFLPYFSILCLFVSDILPDYRVVALPFIKFFNLGEKEAQSQKIVWEGARVYEKVDGSLATLY